MAREVVKLYSDKQLTTHKCVMDHGYHSGPNLLDLEEVGIRSYIAEPDCGRRKWKAKGEKGEEKSKEQKVVYSRIFEPSLLLAREEKLWRHCCVLLFLNLKTALSFLTKS